MIRSLFITCFFLLPFVASAQYLLRGRVTDLSNRAIPYVNIGFVGTEIGTVSTEEGEFSLQLAELPNLSIPLRISCMGYEPVEMMVTAERFGVPMDVKLPESTIALQEMVVKSGSLTTKSYGNTDEKTSMKTNLAISDQPNRNLGAEIGRKFRLGDSPNYVSSLKFFVGFTDYDTLKIRVNFYELESGRPGKVLNSKSIIRQIVDHQTGWLAVNLEEENLVVSGTIVASVEWVGASREGKTFALNITMPAMFQTHYYKYGAQNAWKVFPNMSSAMVLTVETED